MSFYIVFFFLLYDFFQSIKGDLVTDYFVAIKVVAIISILPIVNLATFPIEIISGQRYLLLGVLLITNYFIFLFKERFIAIAKKYKSSPPSDTSIVLTVLYIFGTLVAYFFLA
jgi:hypothetical protein